MAKYNFEDKCVPKFNLGTREVVQLGTRWLNDVRFRHTIDRDIQLAVEGLKEINRPALL